MLLYLILQIFVAAFYISICVYFICCSTQNHLDLLICNKKALLISILFGLLFFLITVVILLKLIQA